jgi:hypothetical protein
MTIFTGNRITITPRGYVVGARSAGDRPRSGLLQLITYLSALFLTFAAPFTHAEVTATLDRDRAALGDTLRLTITATEGEDVNSADLRPLLAEFELLQRSSSSNTSIVNGKRSHTRQLVMDITPRRQGTLKIPPMRVGQQATNPLQVVVGPPPDDDTGGQTVIFEAEVDRDSVYVQGQVLLTLRLQQAINLDNRSISEFELDNAFVKALEQRSFQRTVGGRPWLVHEVRYAIFPEQSGTLEIPAQSFSARESQPRRSFFDMGGGGRLVRRTTEPLAIEVLPRPDSFPPGTWLPASSLNVEESWSTPPEQLRAGESATRTIRIRGEGLQGAQLPPVLFPSTEGLKYYPDQPVITDTEVSSGLLGTRQDSAALVPTRAGEWEIPEIRIPWWDTETGEVRYAVIPGRTITVAAAAAAPVTQDPVTAGTVPGAAESAAAAPSGTGGNALPWQIATIVSAAGWLATLAWLLWTRRRLTGRDAGPGLDNPSEGRAFKQLQAACTSGAAVHARQAMIDWAAALYPQRQPVSLEQVAELFDDEVLNGEIANLNAALYGRGGTNWQGSSLLERAKALRSEHRQRLKNTEEPLSLYPRAA